MKETMTIEEHIAKEFERFKLSITEDVFFGEQSSEAVITHTKIFFSKEIYTHNFEFAQNLARLIARNVNYQHTFKKLVTFMLGSLEAKSHLREGIANVVNNDELLSKCYYTLGLIIINNLDKFALKIDLDKFALKIEKPKRINKGWMKW